MSDLFKSVGGYWFICEQGHRIRQDAPDLQFCPAMVSTVEGQLVPRPNDEGRLCGALIDYRLVDYFTMASYRASEGEREGEGP